MKSEQVNYLLDRRSDLLSELNHIENGKANMPPQWGKKRIKQIEWELQAVNDRLNTLYMAEAA